jgi:putative Ig domain-containing protein
MSSPRNRRFTALSTVSLTGDDLPAGLELNRATGEIAGTPKDSAAATDYHVTLIAHNGILPDAKLPLRITVKSATQQPPTPAPAPAPSPSPDAGQDQAPNAGQDQAPDAPAPAPDAGQDPAPDAGLA